MVNSTSVATAPVEVLRVWLLATSRSSCPDSSAVLTVACFFVSVGVVIFVRRRLRLPSSRRYLRSASIPRTKTSYGHRSFSSFYGLVVWNCLIRDLWLHWPPSDTVDWKHFCLMLTGSSAFATRANSRYKSDITTTTTTTTIIIIIIIIIII